jgi:hypothetical protein
MKTAMKTWIRIASAGFVLTACGRPVGLDVPVKPLQQIHVLVTVAVAAAGPVDAGSSVDADAVDAGSNVDAGSVDAGAGPLQLRAALVWGLQWLPEPFCVLQGAQPESPEVAAVVAAGCRESFGFVPNRPAADIPITPGVPATFDLYDLPAADLMVGDITARIAYASVIVYDDRNGNGMLDFRHPQRQRQRADQINDAGGASDAVYGASFISMTQPDRRLAFLEGDFSALRGVAFYPRLGCADPPKSFSILSASGFSAAAALTSGLAGTIPPEDDPSACATSTLDDTIVIPIPPQAPAALSQLACTSNDEGGVTYYRQAPANPNAPADASAPDDRIDLIHSTWACASLPRIGTNAGAGSSAQQLVIAIPVSPSNACQTTLHYTLRGCENDPFCALPRWPSPTDPNPPAWWPCSTSP